MNKSRKSLSATGLLKTVEKVFETTKTPQIKGIRQNPITLKDCLMSALAMFGLKYESLLQFNDHYASDKLIRHNLKTLYSVNAMPSDTYLRERLDEVNPDEIRKAFTKVFAQAQRGKALEQFSFMDNHYLLAIDGTEVFRSCKLNCDNCCVKNYKDGTKSYYHQILGAAIVHPDNKIVIPLAPEPILKSDGSLKNDCELNAAKRFIKAFRTEHPHLKVIFTTDSLLSNGPLIKRLKDANIKFILGAKPGNHKTLFEFVKDNCTQVVKNTRDGKTHTYNFMNQVPLNDSENNVIVNFLDYVEISPNGKKVHFSWVTDILITKQNVHQIAKGGRARWKIENETFNTLKNQGYNFEHNFGHGHKYLNIIFAMLMMLAFLIDQIQELCDFLFQEALKKRKRKKCLWERLRGLFFHSLIDSWEDCWSAIAYGHKTAKLVPNSS